MKKRQLGIIVLICFLVLFESCNRSRSNSNPPNIILIYADDLGIGLLGHEGQTIIKTPNIDNLADEGIRFRSAYSNMLCAPARASLITGLHDCHENMFEITSAGLYKKISTENSTVSEINTMINRSLSPIPEEQVFLGEIAQKAGYKTAQFGKLEWGFSATDNQLKRHGWDYYLGYLDHVRAHGFYPPFLFENGELKNIPGNTRADCGKTGEYETEKTFMERWDMTGKKVYSQNIFMDGVLSFINENKNEPFFLYFPTQLPHGPVAIPEVHSDYVDDQRLTQIEKEYASMVKMLDDHVGRIVQELKKLDLEDNTIIIFTADNGHETYYSQEGRTIKPYTNMKTGVRFDNIEHKYYSDLNGDVFDGNGGRAGLKRSNLQGGINVPLIVKWPKAIEKGRNSDLLVANYDLLTTLADITGFTGPLKTDGISFFDELMGKEINKEHDYLVYSSFTGPTLITNEGWKIRSDLKKDVFELFYLPDDFKEEHDLSATFPGKKNELKIELLKACEGDFTNGHYRGKNQIKIENI